MRKSNLIPLALLFTLAGCQTGTLPDPNDPKNPDGLTPDNMQSQFGSISDDLYAHVLTGQIDDKQYRAMMKQAAIKLLVGFNVDKVDVTKAWKVAEVMIKAEDWARAKPMLEASVEWAKRSRNEDRRVNDTLRLARVLAEMGDIPNAFKTARTVFDVRPEDAVPILPATLLEIAPAALGKGHDIELAQLLEDAIKANLRARVDPSKEAGKRFLTYRPANDHKAWKLARELYTNANRPDLAEKALEDEQKAEQAAGAFPTVKA